MKPGMRLAPADAEVLYKAAIVYNQFDEVDQTLGSLEKAVKAGYTWTAIRDSPNFDHLWANSRFQQLLRGKQF